MREALLDFVAIESADEERYLEETFLQLTRRQQIILERRSCGHTLEAVGRDLDLTRERVRQIQCDAQKRLVRNAKAALPALSRISEILRQADVADFRYAFHCLAATTQGRITVDALLSSLGWQELYENASWRVKDYYSARVLLRHLAVKEAVLLEDWLFIADEHAIPRKLALQVLDDGVLKLERYGLYVVRTEKIRRDKVHAYLLENTEASTDELLVLLGESKSRNLIAYLSRQEIFTKLLPRDIWTLTALVGKQYKSALPAVLDVLDKYGPVSRDELHRLVLRAHEVSGWRINQCLDDYRIGTMDDGRVWLIEHGAKKREEQEPFRPSHMSTTDTVVGIKRTIGHDIMRGSGTMDSRWLCWRLGLKSTPASITFSHINGAADFTVKRQGGNSSLSAIRELVVDSGLQVGCEVAILLDVPSRTWELRHLCSAARCPARSSSA